MTFSVAFPKFPIYGTGNGDYSGIQFIIQLFLYVIKVIGYPFVYIVEGIGNGIGTGFQSMFSGLFNMTSTVYSDSVGDFAWAGPFAPILVSIVCYLFHVPWVAGDLTLLGCEILEGLARCYAISAVCDVFPVKVRVKIREVCCCSRFVNCLPRCVRS